MTDTKTTQLIELTAEIVANYVAAHQVGVADLPALIRTTHDALAGVGSPEAPAAVEPEVKLTAAQIRKTITPDALVSLIDGKSYKTLKRHLGVNGLTFDEYKKRFGLPADYPSTAPNYSLARSAMAKSIGLGTGGRGGGARKAEAAPAPAAKGKKAKA